MYICMYVCHTHIHMHAHLILATTLLGRAIIIPILQMFIELFAMVSHLIFTTPL